MHETYLWNISLICHFIHNHADKLHYNAGMHYTLWIGVLIQLIIWVKLVAKIRRPNVEYFSMYHWNRFNHFFDTCSMWNTWLHDYVCVEWDTKNNLYNIQYFRQLNLFDNALVYCLYFSYSNVTINRQIWK